MKENNFKNKLLKLVIPITLQQLMLALVSFTNAVMIAFIHCRRFRLQDKTLQKVFIAE